MPSSTLERRQPVTRTPTDIADADQHFAQVAHDLSQIVAAYRAAATSREIDHTSALDALLGMLSEPKNVDGSDVSHDVHAGTLANLLTVAIDRLAARDGAQ
jgi:hypothetical protein